VIALTQQLEGIARDLSEREAQIETFTNLSHEATEAYDKIASEQSTTYEKVLKAYEESVTAYEMQRQKLFESIGPSASPRRYRCW